METDGGEYAVAWAYRELQSEGTSVKNQAKVWAAAALMCGGCAMSTGADDAPTPRSSAPRVGVENGDPGIVRNEPAEPEFWEDEGYYGDEYAELGAHSASLSGAMGAYSDDAWDVTLVNAGMWSNSSLEVMIDAQTEGGYGMVMINAWSEYGEPIQIRPGVVLRTYSATSSPDEPYVDVIGCSGEMPGEWEFDEGSEDATVEFVLGEDAETMVGLYQATLYNGQHVSGAFELPLRGLDD